MDSLYISNSERARNVEIVQLSSSSDEQNNPARAPSEPLPSCPICLSDILDPLEKAVTACTHTFCRSCLAAWLRVKRFCPLCKRRIHTYVTQIRDDANFTEVDVPPSPVHDNIHPYRHSEEHQRGPHPTTRHFQAHDQPHLPYEYDPQTGGWSRRQGQQQRQLENEEVQQRQHGGDLRVGSLPAYPQRMQSLRTGDTGDLLRQLHRIADRLAEDDAPHNSGPWEPQRATPRFRRASVLASNVMQGADSGERDTDHGRRGTAMTLTAARSQQQQPQTAQRQPRPYFFRVQQRLAATVTATAGGASSLTDPWNTAAAAAAAYVWPTGPAPALAQPLAAPAVQQELPTVDEEDATFAARRRVYELGCRATGVISEVTRWAPGTSGCDRGVLGATPGVTRGSEAASAATTAAVSASRAADRQQQLERWVSRELQALLRTSDVSLLRARVVGLVDRYGVDRDWAMDYQQRTGSQAMEVQTPWPWKLEAAGASGSGAVGGCAAAEEGPVAALQPFLFGRAARFWHELRYFVLSGLNVQEYDARVQYQHDAGVSGGVNDANAPPPPPRPMRRLRLTGAPLALSLAPSAPASLSNSMAAFPLVRAIQQPHHQHHHHHQRQNEPHQRHHHYQRQVCSAAPSHQNLQQHQSVRPQGLVGDRAATRVVIDLTLDSDSSSGDVDIVGDGCSAADGVEIGRCQWEGTRRSGPAGRPAERDGDRGDGGGNAGDALGSRAPPSRTQWETSSATDGVGASAVVATVADVRQGRRRHRWDEQSEDVAARVPVGQVGASGVCGGGLGATVGRTTGPWMMAAPLAAQAAKAALAATQAIAAAVTPVAVPVALPSVAPAVGLVEIPDPAAEPAMQPAHQVHQRSHVNLGQLPTEEPGDCTAGLKPSAAAQTWVPVVGDTAAGASGGWRSADGYGGRNGPQAGWEGHARKGRTEMGEQPRAGNKEREQDCGAQEAGGSRAPTERNRNSGSNYGGKGSSTSSCRSRSRSGGQRCHGGREQSGRRSRCSGDVERKGVNSSGVDSSGALYGRKEEEELERGDGRHDGGSHHRSRRSRADNGSEECKRFVRHNISYDVPRCNRELDVVDTKGAAVLVSAAGVGHPDDCRRRRRSHSRGRESPRKDCRRRLHRERGQYDVDHAERRNTASHRLDSRECEHGRVDGCLVGDGCSDGARAALQRRRQCALQEVSLAGDDGDLQPSFSRGDRWQMEVPVELQ